MKHVLIVLLALLACGRMESVISEPNSDTQNVVMLQAEDRGGDTSAHSLLLRDKQDCGRPKVSSVRFSDAPCLHACSQWDGTL